MLVNNNITRINGVLLIVPRKVNGVFIRTHVSAPNTFNIHSI